MLEPQVRRVLGGHPHPAPPQDRLLLDEVVEPCLPYLGAGEGPAVAVVRKGTQETEGSRDVVVRRDEGILHLLVDVVVDLPELLRDRLVRPPFERLAGINGDNLPQHTRVYPQSIVGGNHVDSTVVRAGRACKYTLGPRPVWHIHVARIRCKTIPYPLFPRLPSPF